MSAACISDAPYPSVHPTKQSKVCRQQRIRTVQTKRNESRKGVHGRTRACVVQVCFRSDFEAAASSHALLASLIGQAVAAHFLRIESGRVVGMRGFE
jgi:hypothetical protein